MRSLDEFAPRLLGFFESIDRLLCGGKLELTLALQKKSAMPPSKDYEGYATRVL
jgi:hypothetical protein